MPIQSGQVGRYGIKATPDILGPHKGIPWRSPALSNAMPTINGRTHDSTGALLGSCTVWAMSTQTDTVMGTTTSDANGLFSLTLYTSGSFYLVAYKTSLAALSTVLPAQISLSRASSGTYFNSSGVLTTVASNTARFDYTYNGTSWVAAGLLIEEQRTNFTDTNIINDGVKWEARQMTVGSAVTGPDGALSAYAVAPDSNNSFHDLTNTIYATTNPITCSLYVEANGYSQIAIREGAVSGASAVFSLASGGSVSGTYNAGAYTTSNATITDIGGGWFRISATFYAGGANNNFRMSTVVLNGTWTTGDPLSISFVGNGSSILYALPQQEQVAGTPTSYIYTTGVTATRSADIASSTDATLLAANGWIVEVGEMQASTAATLLGINTVIGLGATSGNALTTADGGAQTTGNTGTWTSQNRGGLAFDSTPRVSIDLDGGTVVTAGNTPSTPTNLYFGNTNNGASGFLNGHIRAIAAYSAITDGQLPTVSTVGASLTATITPTFSVQWAGTSSAPDVSGTTVNTLIPT